MFDVVYVFCGNDNGRNWNNLGDMYNYILSLVNFVDPTTSQKTT